MRPAIRKDTVLRRKFNRCGKKIGISGYRLSQKCHFTPLLSRKFYLGSVFPGISNSGDIREPDSVNRSHQPRESDWLASELSLSSTVIALAQCRHADRSPSSSIGKWLERLQCGQQLFT